jgi:hypothetical protein
MAAAKKPTPAKAKAPAVKATKKAAVPTPVKKSVKESKAVAKVVPKKTAKKRVRRKPPAITDKQFEKWFMAQDVAMFRLLAKKWNETNLKITVPNHKEYDQWLNYFKHLPARVTKMLASSGLDILPTDGYAALLLWHDIMQNPNRITKIYQAGLTAGSAKNKKSIVDLANANDRLGVLKAVRDEIAAKLQKGAGARDTAALSREMTEIMTQISDYEKRQGPKKTTMLGQLTSDIDMRRRPKSNGGGSRNTSFKSRVTIKDIER